MNNPIKHLTTEVARMKLDDGDIVLVRCAEVISLTTAQRIRSHVEMTLRQVGRVAPVMILDRGVSIEIIAASRLKKMPLKELIDHPETGEA